MAKGKVLAQRKGLLHKEAMISQLHSIRTIVAMLAITTAGGIASAASSPYQGAWELTMPDSTAGWLGVEEANGGVKASMLWTAGSVEPVASAKIENGHLVLTREHTVERKDPAGKKTKVKLTQTITATIDGDKLKLQSVKPRDDGQGEDRAEFTGKRTPPMPPAPDLSKIHFGPELTLFNGRNLTGWRLTDPTADNGWSARDGILINTHAPDDGKTHKRYGNLCTQPIFDDFNLKLEVLVKEHGNSGIYLRGIYEVQVEECYGKPPTAHNMGAIYSRIKPSKNASNPAGQWQKFDITLVDRHVTVILNGTEVISNQPVAGCTGGAMWSDVSRSGPIYLQGDHGNVEYRNLSVRRVLK